MIRVYHLDAKIWKQLQCFLYVSHSITLHNSSQESLSALEKCFQEPQLCLWFLHAE